MENIQEEIKFFEDINNNYLKSEIEIEFDGWAEADLVTGSTSDDD